jgi:hypothetical protein
MMHLFSKSKMHDQGFIGCERLAGAQWAIEKQATTDSCGDKEQLQSFSQA